MLTNLRHSQEEVKSGSAQVYLTLSKELTQRRLQVCTGNKDNPSGQDLETTVEGSKLSFPFEFQITPKV